VSDNLTDAAESRVLNWITGNTTTAPTLPLKMRLMTANGSDSAAGTEVTGGSYAPVSVTVNAASGGGAVTISADAVFAGMPAATVTGVEIWDSAGTPFRWLYGALTANKTTGAGDDLKIATTDFSLSIG
jgi:hypothetical protein